MLVDIYEAEMKSRFRHQNEETEKRLFTLRAGERTRCEDFLKIEEITRFSWKTLKCDLNGPQFKVILKH